MKNRESQISTMWRSSPRRTVARTEIWSSLLVMTSTRP